MFFNKSIVLGEVPQKWKISSVAPIPKPRKDPCVPYSYRPISVVSKILEAYALLTCESNQLSHAQWGFTPELAASSTITPLIKISIKTLAV